MLILYIITATFVISLLSLVSLLLIRGEKKNSNTNLLVLVSLSAGTLIGSAFLHLLPEAIENNSSQQTYLIIIGAFIFFLCIEKVLHWHHCHYGRCEQHATVYMNLFGDFIHNFLDGLVIAAAFSTSLELGVTTTLAVALHEIPQEIGDFGVLIYYGFSKAKALLYNFLVASTAIAGGIIGYLWISKVEVLTSLLLPFAIGGFVYIAASDLVPEIKRDENGKNSFISLLTFIFGIFLMYLLTFIE